ncbi:cytochrome b5 [Phlegmacium glaucopus]|nr:cytochrome b5 [Phlegmacium glaucopus]
MFVVLKYVVALVVPIAYIFYRRRSSPTVTVVPQEDNKRPLKSVMQAARADLAPPKDDPYTTEQLKQYDGSDPTKPILVAIKGTIFDVSAKIDVYGPGKSYNVFAGKDGSRGLGLSSLKAEDAVADYTGLDEKDMKVLNDWHSFFSKRYNIVGRVVDGPVPDADAPSNL